MEFKVSMVGITDLIDILLELEEEDVKYVNLHCTLDPSGDSISVVKYKKGRKKKKLLTQEMINKLLNKS